MDKVYRFFFHYNRQYNKMSVHFKKKCYSVTDVICCVACESKWNPISPKLVMQGKAKNVVIQDDKAFIL